MRTSALVFWVVTPRGVVGRYHRDTNFLQERTSAPGLKMEVVCSSETLVSTYTSTRRYSTEDQHPFFSCRKNINGLFYCQKEKGDMSCSFLFTHKISNFPDQKESSINVMYLKILVLSSRFFELQIE
jgi:hypothetical protein